MGTVSRCSPTSGASLARRGRRVIQAHSSSATVRSPWGRASMMSIEPRTSRSSTSTTDGVLWTCIDAASAIGNDCVFGSPHSEPPVEGCGAEASSRDRLLPQLPRRSHRRLSVRVSRSAPQRPLGSPRVVQIVMETQRPVGLNCALLPAPVTSTHRRASHAASRTAASPASTAAQDFQATLTVVAPGVWSTRKTSSRSTG